MRYSLALISNLLVVFVLKIIIMVCGVEKLTVFDVSVEINSARETSRIFRKKSATYRVVVSGAVV